MKVNMLSEAMHEVSHAMTVSCNQVDLLANIVHTCDNGLLCSHGMSSVTINPVQGIREFDDIKVLAGNVNVFGCDFKTSAHNISLSSCNGLHSSLTSENEMNEQLMVLGCFVVEDLRNLFKHIWFVKTGLKWNDISCSQLFFDSEPPHSQETEKLKFIRENPLRMWDFDTLCYAFTKTSTFGNKMNTVAQTKLSLMASLIHEIFENRDKANSLSEEMVCSHFACAVESMNFDTATSADIHDRPRFPGNFDNFECLVLPLVQSPFAYFSQLYQYEARIQADMVLNALQKLKS